MWPSTVLTLVLLMICSANGLITVIGPVTRHIVDWFYDEAIVPSNSTITGYVEPTNPPDGCQNVAPPSFPTDFKLDKIALINDTNCNLMTKICSAQAVGYDAVLISRTPDWTNEQRNQILGGIPECTFNISVSLINSDDAKVIRDQYAYDPYSKDNFELHIKPNALPWTIKQLMAFSVAVIPFAICGALCWVCRNIHESYRNWRAKNAIQNNLNKLFPPVKFREGDSYEDCAICWCHFTSGEKLRVLKCSHAYHPKCIDAWIIKYQRVCPMCKRLVVLGDSFDAANPDTSETTPLLASSSTTNYTSGPSLTPNSNVGVPNASDLVPGNTNQQSEEISFQSSVNNDTRPRLEQSVQPAFIV